MRGSDYCSLHGGRKARGNVHMTQVPRFYSKYLSKTLCELVEEQMARAPSEQLSLLEELAHMRITTAQAIKMFDAAVSTGKDEIIASATMVVRQALQEVARMCESAARVDALGKDKISAHAIHFVIMQVVKIASQVFGDDERVIAFERALREEVRVPGDVQGTDLTPDADAVDMDDTVPDDETETEA